MKCTSVFLFTAVLLLPQEARVALQIADVVEIRLQSMPQTTASRWLGFSEAKGGSKEIQDEKSQETIKLIYDLKQKTLIIRGRVSEGMTRGVRSKELNESTTNGDPFWEHLRSELIKHKGLDTKSARALRRKFDTTNKVRSFNDLPEVKPLLEASIHPNLKVQLWRHNGRPTDPENTYFEEIEIVIVGDDFQRTVLEPGSFEMPGDGHE